MNDTVKLIIEMPKEAYEQIVEAGDLDYLEVITAIENGIPLDDVKAEIEKIPTDYCGGYIGLGKKEVLDILDNIGNAESEKLADVGLLTQSLEDAIDCS